MYDYLFLALVFLNLLDVVSTHLCLNSNFTRELNPVVVYLSKKVGLVPGLFILKVPFLSAIYSLKYFSIIAATANVVIVGFLVSVYVLIVINNLYVLKKVSEIED